MTTKNTWNKHASPTGSKVALYARVSTKKQDEAQQIPAIVETFKLDDYIIYKEEVSAWSIDKEEKRAELQRLIKDIKAKRIDKLYVWHIDRLYRNRIKLRQFFELCYFHGVEIYSLNQTWLNDFQNLREQMPENFRFLIDNIHSLVLDVYAQTAEDESRTKSERVKLKVVKEEGKPTRSVSGKKWGRRALPKKTIEQVATYHKQGKSIRWIAQNVCYYDKNRNPKQLSVGSVHKIISQNSA